ncbi:MAG: sn-glycerol-1-phosphate dehydrogenase [Spirochaetaceae bacterium]|jgi:glycerol-1-phosphate dehydrogenase [NAD(P)+]|nr:sn-glycerol-1-phosphate dehydrogenase [Spirochaetaceae bacterium]
MIPYIMANRKCAALSLEDCLSAADETEVCVVRENALEEAPEILRDCFGADPVCFVVSGGYTYEAAGKRLEEALKSAGLEVRLHVFPPCIHADYAHVEALSRLFAASPSERGPLVPVAAGSGTINDVVKRAAFEQGLPYFCAATAASVDGYTANGAALLYEGFKQTFPCTAPRAVAADTKVLARAPAYLASSGFGDLAGKITAGTDWIIAEKAGRFGAPGAAPIDEKAWAMTQSGLMDALNASADAAKGDCSALEALFSALAVTGFAMQYHKSSRPVSSAEHSFSHVWEMDGLTMQDGAPVTHGHKVTIGTLLATAFTELFFADSAGPPETPRGFARPGLPEREAAAAGAFSRASATARDLVLKTVGEKFMEPERAKQVNAGFLDCWQEIRSAVLERLLPYGELRALLKRAACPLAAEAINLSRTQAIAAARRAQMIRNKYSVLDLAWDLGCFETVLAALEDSGQYLR